RRETFEVEYRLRRADGQFRWVHDRGTPVFSSAGEFMGYLGSSIDVTERKLNEETQRGLLQELDQLKNQLEAVNICLQEDISYDHNFNEIVGDSPAIKSVLSKVEKVAPLNTTVLVTGETGTGKELVARAIHSASSRSHQPFVKVNCAALPSTL